MTLVQVHKDGSTSPLPSTPDEQTLEQISDPETTSYVEVMVNGQLYPAATSERCRVCRSRHRAYIESKVAVGVKYSVLADHIASLPLQECDEPHPSARSIANHIRADHVPLYLKNQRDEIEEIYAASGGELEDASNTLVNRVVVAHAIMRKYSEKVLKEDFQPTTQDAAIANKIIEDFEKSHSKDGISEEMWRNAMFAYIDILLPEIAPERREAVSRALESHPAMQAVAAAALKKRIEDGETVPGEVV